jgi:hypothetical protein
MCSMLGATSFRRETYLPPSDGSKGVKPVTLRPGLAKLST